MILDGKKMLLEMQLTQNLINFDQFLLFYFDQMQTYPNLKFSSINIQ